MPTPDPGPEEELQDPHSLASSFEGDSDTTRFGELLTPIEEDLQPSAGLDVATRGEPLDKHRFSLATKLLWLVSATTIILLLSAIFAPVDHLEAVKSIANVVFGPLITLLGTSFAWYYASRKSD